MPATKKISPRNITLKVGAIDARSTASGKHSTYPKRPAAAAPLLLNSTPTEVKRVSGSWKGERLEFIYWREEGIARWTDLTTDEAAAIDRGEPIEILSNVPTEQVKPVEPNAVVEEPTEEQPTFAPEAGPVKPKRERKSRKAVEMA